jgi:CheY-like chemotaxis protein
MEVKSTFDCVQASMQAMRTQPDLIVLDINMPGGSGLNILKRLKAGVKTKHIPVVVISGTVGREMQEAVQRIGAAAFLQKPLDRDEFCSLLTSLVEKSQHRSNAAPVSPAAVPAR